MELMRKTGIPLPASLHDEPEHSPTDMGVL